MEKLNSQNCLDLFHRCRGEIAASQSLTKTEVPMPKMETNAPAEMGSKKPWSVFGDLYWI